MEQVPGDAAIHGNYDGQPEPGVPTGVTKDQIVVEQNGERHQHVADDPEFRDDDGVEPDDPLTLPPFRVLDIEVEFPGIRLSRGALEHARKHLLEEGELYHRLFPRARSIA